MLSRRQIRAIQLHWEYNWLPPTEAMEAFFRVTDRGLSHTQARRLLVNPLDRIFFDDLLLGHNMMPRFTKVEWPQYLLHEVWVRSDFDHTNPIFRHRFMSIIRETFGFIPTFWLGLDDDYSD